MSPPVELLAYRCGGSAGLATKAHRLPVSSLGVMALGHPNKRNFNGAAGALATQRLGWGRVAS